VRRTPLPSLASLNRDSPLRGENEDSDTSQLFHYPAPPRRRLGKPSVFEDDRGMLPIVARSHSEIPSDQELGTVWITFGWQRRHCADESSMSSLILGASLFGFDPLPLGVHRVVELLPMRRIRENLGKSRHRPRKPTLPGGEVNQVLTKRPAATDLTSQVRI